MSSWTRAIVVSLAIVHAANPCRPVPRGFNLNELFLPGVSPAFRIDTGWFTWRNLFLRIDRILKWWELHGSRSLRRKALRTAEQWMLERFQGSDGLGAIYPPMMYAIMALDVLGYPPGHPDRQEALRQFEHLITDDGRRFFFQPCFSAIWDTAITAYALGEAGLPAVTSAPLERAANWFLSKEIRRKGDWSVKRPHTEPSGWAFEFNNEFYPDIDDTAMVMLALQHMRASRPEAQQACEKRLSRASGNRPEITSRGIIRPALLLVWIRIWHSSLGVMKTSISFRTWASSKYLVCSHARRGRGR